MTSSGKNIKNDMAFGFQSGELDNIIDVISSFAEVEEAAIFGSRALGNFKNGSDVDLSLKGNIGKIYLNISYILNEETLMPYKFDVLWYKEIRNLKLKEHIDKFGKAIYLRNKRQNNIKT